MSVRPPRALAPRKAEDPLGAALQQEVLAEKASTYGRLLARLELAIGRLRAFDTARDAAEPDNRPQDEARSHALRADLVEGAGQALWHVVIHRELIGLPGTERFLRDQAIPAEVRLRMGVSASGPRRSR